MSAPPPPPPPAFNLSSAAASNGPQGRNLLLQSIRDGKSLKKTVTVDKSGPLIPGKARNGTSSNNSSLTSSPSSRSTNNNSNSNAPMGLGGLFAGGMPKLKPTGLRGTIVEKDNNNSPPSPTVNLSPSNNNSGTMKRGPPPIPPPAAQKPQLITTQLSTESSNEMIKGFGKPMIAPKPPAPSPVSPSSGSATLQKPYPPPKKLDLIRGGSVSRAQSMRLPRSPPVLAPQQNPSHHQSQDFLNETQQQQQQRPIINRVLRPPIARPPSPPISRPQQQSPNPSITRVAPPPPSRIAVTAPSMPPPPPPPPHRSNPGVQRLAPPPPPPTPPTRNLSLSNDQFNNTNNIMDMENRFSDMFHSIATFPNPETFRNVPKLYNSKNAAKQQAPAPPQQSSPTPSSMIQLNASAGGKQWQHNAASSAC